MTWFLMGFGLGMVLGASVVFILLVRHMDDER